jgi:hypothetical protein
MELQIINSWGVELSVLSETLRYLTYEMNTFPFFDTKGSLEIKITVFVAVGVLRPG